VTSFCNNLWIHVLGFVVHISSLFLIRCLWHSDCTSNHGCQWLHLALPYLYDSIRIGLIGTQAARNFKTFGVHVTSHIPWAFNKDKIQHFYHTIVECCIPASILSTQDLLGSPLCGSKPKQCKGNLKSMPMSINQEYNWRIPYCTWRLIKHARKKNVKKNHRCKLRTLRLQSSHGASELLGYPKHCIFCSTTVFMARSEPLEHLDSTKRLNQKMKKSEIKAKR